MSYLKAERHRDWKTNGTRVRATVQIDPDALSISPTMPVPKATGASSITQTSGTLSRNTRKTVQTETHRLAKSHIFKGNQ